MSYSLQILSNRTYTVRFAKCYVKEENVRLLRSPRLPVRSRGIENARTSRALCDVGCTLPGLQVRDHLPEIFDAFFLEAVFFLLRDEFQETLLLKTLFRGFLLLALLGLAH